MKILIAGGTGFIGTALVSSLLARGHEPVLLSRQKNAALGPSVPRYLEWDAQGAGAWAGTMEAADAVINLAGEPIAGRRWTAAQKEKILKSRIETTRVLIEAMSRASSRPKVLINASAVGYYGNVPEGDVTETHPQGTGFLAEVCGRWEEEALRADSLGIRTVILRTGVVLAKGGGALAKMLPPFRFFLGGPLGSGSQWFPWVHRDDVVRAVFFALENDVVAGPVNVTAPWPVTQRDFCATLGKVLKRPFGAAVPAFVLKVLLGEMSAVLLEGQKAIPRKLLESGYAFKFPVLKDALEEILNG
ncbi:MAG: TIGR01777 family oxidoreductase [Candidatus Omnitrophica bacterium]|nr:TIGR01777 family oxidoreductase [Candidatus Omnitrophota bacterium]